MIFLSSGNISIEEFYQIVVKNELIDIDHQSIKLVNDSFDFLSDFSRNKIIYGINTGFGPMAQYAIQNSDLHQLQYNLIRSHCSGSGEVLSSQFVRAILLSRLSTLLLGKSGIHPSWVKQIQFFLNHNICPVIYAHGGVGASGDLVQLAHLALALIGEGEVIYEGTIRNTNEVLSELGIEQVTIHLREGLAIMNGTSAMNGIGILNIIKAERLIDWTTIASAMICEIVESFEDHFSDELNYSKLHKGQRKIAKKLQTLLIDSKLIRKRSDVLYTINKEKVFKDKVQEYYSIRCVPQILGPIQDTIEYSKKVLMNEINSANDNPIVDLETQNVYHGGNFHGDYVALEMDKLRIAITKSTMLAERQINFLMNNKLNEKLPPFINLGTLGLNFGLQGLQFTATSTTAECQALSTSLYIHSIPNNNDNQDIVSMGANSALLTDKVITNSYEVLSICFWSITQALEYLDNEKLMSSSTRKIYKTLKNIISNFDKDQIKYPTLKLLKTFFEQSNSSEISQCQ